MVVAADEWGGKWTPPATPMLELSPFREFGLFRTSEDGGIISAEEEEEEVVEPAVVVKHDAHLSFFGQRRTGGGNKMLMRCWGSK